MKDKKLSNEQILKLIEDFYALPENERLQKKIGTGAFKNVFDLDSNYVLKEIMEGDPDIGAEDMVNDYISSKQLSKHVPTETPMLITREGKMPVQLQKKLKTDPVTVPIQMAKKPKNLRADDWDKLTEFVKQSNQSLDDKGINSLTADIHHGNVAFDEFGNPKVIDNAAFVANPLTLGKEGAQAMNKPLKTARKNAIKRILSSNKGRVYRQVPIIGPLLGLGVAGYTEDSEAAIPLLNEAEPLGPEEGSEDWEIENPQANPQERLKKLKALMGK